MRLYINLEAMGNQADVSLSKSSNSEELMKSFKLQGERNFQGLKIAVENRKGGVRKGTGQDGEEWVTKMFWPYGYIRGTEGKDGEGLDCYIGPNDFASHAYIVHQNDPESGAYDEDKVMLGFDSPEHARDAYLAHYDDQQFLGPITAMPMADFVEKVKSGKYDGRMLKSLFGSFKLEKGFRYRRGDIGSTMRAAIKTAQAHGKPMHVYGTMGGFTIDHNAPPFNQSHMKVHPDGKVETHHYDHKKCAWDVTTKESGQPLKKSFDDELIDILTGV